MESRIAPSSLCCSWFAALGAVGLSGALGLGCATAATPEGAATPQVVTAPSASSGNAPAQQRVAPLPPPSAAEAALATELREYVTALVRAGERNSAHEWNLAVATDDIAERLESFGYGVTREGFMYENAVAQNLVVHIARRTEDAKPASANGSAAQAANFETLLIGARYDSALGSPGADDNATGAAALLALAKRLAHSQPSKALRIVFFSDAAGRSSYQGSGAFQHAQALQKGALLSSPFSGAEDEAKRAARQGLAVLELWSLGVYNTQPGSQQYPAGMPRVRDTADFVELTTYTESSALGSQLASAMKAATALPLLTSLHLDHAQVPENAAHRAFIEQCPSLMLSDTRQLRSAAVGTAQDTIDNIDFDRLSRVTLSLEAGLRQLLAL